MVESEENNKKYRFRDRFSHHRGPVARPRIVHNKLFEKHGALDYLFFTRRNVPLIRRLLLYLRTLIFNVPILYILRHIVLRDARGAITRNYTHMENIKKMEEECTNMAEHGEERDTNNTRVTCKRRR